MNYEDFEALVKSSEFITGLNERLCDLTDRADIQLYIAYCNGRTETTEKVVGFRQAINPNTLGMLGNNIQTIELRFEMSYCAARDDAPERIVGSGDFRYTHCSGGSTGVDLVHASGRKIVVAYIIDDGSWSNN